MTDYSKLKVPSLLVASNNKVTELKDLLAQRSLPVSGKKEELVARLTEHDADSAPAADLGDLAPPEDDYDWDTPTEKPAPSSKPAPVTKPPTATKPAPAAKPIAAPEVAKPASVTSPAASTVTPAEADAALAIELEKRKKRAERFGIPVSETVKAVERSQRFGVTNPTPEESKKAARGKKFGNQVWTKNGETKKTGAAQKSGEIKEASRSKSPAKKILDDPAEAEKARKRAERFGGGGEAKKIKT
jgi:SAP domain-containing ribonucleoprotein